MGRYVTLESGTGYLGNYPSLDPVLQEQAEDEADDRVDCEFQLWDRSLWTTRALPPEVGKVARKIATAEYLCLDVAQSNALTAEVPSLAVSLRESAKETVDGIIGRGWVLGQDGERQYARDETARPMFASVDR